MSWLEAVPALLGAAFLVIVPGLPVAWALGARGLALLGLGVGASVSGVAVAAVVAPLVGLPWSAAAPFAVTLPLAAVAFVLRAWWTRRTPAVRAISPWGAPFLVGVVGIVVGGGLIAATAMQGIGSPANASQTYDAIFHLNAVRSILDTGDASPLHMAVSTPDRGGTFYPTAWHAIAAAAAQFGGDVVAGANAAAVVSAAVVWPIGVVFLVEQVFGAQKVAIAAAGVLSAAFVAFPLMLVEYGVLYPNLLGTALVPIGLGALVLALGVSEAPQLEVPGRWLLAAWLLPGIGLAHPNAVFTLAVFAAPLVVWAIVAYDRRTREEARRGIRLTAAILGAVFVAGALALVWTRLLPQDNLWLPYQRFPQAFGEVLLNAPRQRQAAIAVSVIAIIGIFAAVRVARYRWLIGSFGVATVLYVFATGWEPGRLRDLVTGLWYNDTFRLASLMPLVVLPIAVLGVLVIVRWLQRLLRTTRISRWRPVADRPAIAAAVVAAVVLVALVPVTQDRTIAFERDRLARAYQPERTDRVLSEDELALFEDVRELVPEDAVVAGNPWNGSALVYAFTGRQALFAHVGGAYGDERWTVAESLDDGTAAACRAAADLGVTHLLDFGDDYVFDGDPRAERFPGFDDPADSDVLTPIAREGDAVLYEITGCEQ
ncbi:hypothetical protein GCM10009819_28070 [Agromyces tropicus]|uniref:Uncharacterized protein n=1 Tax=Agromyces tropicus TaxID=555371 RepID=A0ABN2UQV9_9MICO